MTEIQILRALRKIFSEEAVYKTATNQYGDRCKFEFRFWDKLIIGRELDKELEDNGFKVFNRQVGSHVHGFTQRVIRHKNNINII